MKEKTFELNIRITDDGKDVQTQVKIDGAVHPMTLVDVLVEVIPTALQGNKMMLSYLGYLLSEGKRSGPEGMETLKIDLLGFKRPEDHEA